MVSSNKSMISPSNDRFSRRFTDGSTTAYSCLHSDDNHRHTDGLVPRPSTPRHAVSQLSSTNCDDGELRSGRRSLALRLSYLHLWRCFWLLLDSLLRSRLPGCCSRLSFMSSLHRSTQHHLKCWRNQGQQKCLHFWFVFCAIETYFRNKASLGCQIKATPTQHSLNSSNPSRQSVSVNEWGTGEETKTENVLITNDTVSHWSNQRIRLPAMHLISISMGGRERFSRVILQTIRRYASSSTAVSPQKATVRSYFLRLINERRKQTQLDDIRLEPYISKGVYTESGGIRPVSDFQIVDRSSISFVRCRNGIH